QAVQLDGTHQRIETIVEPGYPEPLAGQSAIVLPNGRVRMADGLDQPILRETMVGVERQLPGQIRLNAMLIRRRGSHLLRGVDLNAPDSSGVRPDPTAGTMTEIRSTASSSFDAVSVNLNLARPDRRVFVAANYMLSRAIDEADSPFSLPANAADPGAERG